MRDMSPLESRNDTAPESNGFDSRTDLPSRAIVPDVGSINRLIIRRSVRFPATASAEEHDCFAPVLLEA